LQPILTQGVDVYLMNADGSAVERLSDIGQNVSGGGAPYWKPDGTAIMFSAFLTKTINQTPKITNTPINAGYEVFMINFASLTSVTAPSSPRDGAVAVSANTPAQGSTVHATLTGPSSQGSRATAAGVVTLGSRVLSGLPAGPVSFAVPLNANARRTLVTRRQATATLRLTVSQPGGKASVISRNVRLSWPRR
jgi:Tol biopolymer transport system component